MTRLLPGVALHSGATMPALGLGTWRLGERKRQRPAEIAALRLGIERGMPLIDSAEMYGEGDAEVLVGDAIAGRREAVFLVSKFYPQHASARGVIAACAASLRRLATDWLDLYLLHWRGKVPLADTIAGLETLRAEGRIRAWGVSNFDRADMEELLRLPGGEHCAANQVLYHLGCRGIEWDLLPLCRRHRVAVMAYSPLDEGRLLKDRQLRELALSLEVTPARLALSWLLAQQVAVIAKAADPAHVEDNAGALSLTLSPTVQARIDQLFPPPAGPSPLRMI